MYYTGLEMLYRASAKPQPQYESHNAAGAGPAVERVADGLRNMGVSNSQLREMARRRELVQDIQVQSPVDGFVLKRNVSTGLRFDRGFEFYRIADLKRVWILADVYRDQLPFIRRGAAARVIAPEGAGHAAGDRELPVSIFDDATQTQRCGEVANLNLTPARHVRRCRIRATCRPRSSCPPMPSWIRG
jgi:hypothetical protein